MLAYFPVLSPNTAWLTVAGPDAARELTAHQLIMHAGHICVPRQARHDLELT